MQRKSKTWKVEVTAAFFKVMEIDERFTFKMPKKLIQNYVVDYDPEFSQDLHYLDLVNGQVLCFSEVDLMITDPKRQDENGEAVIFELSNVMTEAFLLIKGVQWHIEGKEEDDRHFQEWRRDVTYQLNLFANLGFKPARDFSRILKGVL